MKTASPQSEPVGPVRFSVRTAVMGAITGGTLGWIAIGLATHGDFLAGGSRIGLSLALLAGITLGCVGGYLGGTARIWRRLLIGTTLASVLFWCIAPSGWWVTPPPPPDASK